MDVSTVIVASMVILYGLVGIAVLIKAEIEQYKWKKRQLREKLLREM